MRAIDIHAHSTPQCFQREVLQGRSWHGMTAAEGELHNPRNAWTPEQRIEDMDSIGVDVQIVSTNVAFYKYDEEVRHHRRHCLRLQRRSSPDDDGLSRTGFRDWPRCRCRMCRRRLPNWNAPLRS